MAFNVVVGVSRDSSVAWLRISKRHLTSRSLLFNHFICSAEFMVTVVNHWILVPIKLFEALRRKACKLLSGRH